MQQIWITICEIFNQNLAKQLFPKIIQECLFQTNFDLCIQSLNTSVSTVTRPKGSISVLGRDSSLHSFHIGSEAHQASYSMDTKTPLPEMKLLGREV
jgi:hypothetical protein